MIYTGNQAPSLLNQVGHVQTTKHEDLYALSLAHGSMAPRCKPD
jgi:hypothetical protein